MAHAQAFSPNFEAPAPSLSSESLARTLPPPPSWPSQGLAFGSPSCGSWERAASLSCCSCPPPGGSPLFLLTFASKAQAMVVGQWTHSNTPRRSRGCLGAAGPGPLQGPGLLPVSSGCCSLPTLPWCLTRAHGLEKGNSTGPSASSSNVHLALHSEGPAESAGRDSSRVSLSTHFTGCHRLAPARPGTEAGAHPPDPGMPLFGRHDAAESSGRCVSWRGGSLSRPQGWVQIKASNPKNA